MFFFRRFGVISSRLIVCVRGAGAIALFSRRIFGFIIDCCFSFFIVSFFSFVVQQTESNGILFVRQKYINFYAAFSFEQISFIRSTEKSPLCCVSRCLAAIPNDTLPKIEKKREKISMPAIAAFLSDFHWDAVWMSIVEFANDWHESVNIDCAVFVAPRGLERSILFIISHILLFIDIFALLNDHPLEIYALNVVSMCSSGIF